MSDLPLSSVQGDCDAERVAAAGMIISLWVGLGRRVLAGCPKHCILKFDRWFLSHVLHQVACVCIPEIMNFFLINYKVVKSAVELEMMLL